MDSKILEFMSIMIGMLGIAIAILAGIYIGIPT